MENQRISLLKQKNRWGLTMLSIVLCLAATPLLAGLLLVPQVMSVLPVAVLLLMGYVGPVSALVCLFTIVTMSTMMYGTVGAVCSVVFLMPMMIASTKTAGDGMPFWKSVGISAVTMFLSVSAMIAALSYMAGTDVVTVLMDSMQATYAGFGASIDPVLALVSEMGLVSAPEGVDMAAVAAGAALSADVRAQMIKELLFSIDMALRLELPAQMATGSLIAGLFGQALLRKGMLRRNLDTPYVPLREWRIPKGWGAVLGVTYLVLLAASYMLPEQTESMYYVFANVFDRIFVLQGIAALCWLLHKKGKKGFLEGIVFVAGYTVLGSVVIVFGIADQAFDFFHRRAELDPAQSAT